MSGKSLLLQKDFPFSFFLRFFSCGPLLKSLLNLLHCCFCFFVFFFNLFIYGCVGSSFLCEGFSPGVASGGHSSSLCAGLSPSRPLLLRSTGSRRAGSVIVAHEPSCSVACGIFPDQGSNPCPLHWQADSQPLHHQGSPVASVFMFWFFGREACGILAPGPGIEPTPPALEGTVLTTGPPGKSQDFPFSQGWTPLLPGLESAASQGRAPVSLKSLGLLGAGGAALTHGVSLTPLCSRLVAACPEVLWGHRRSCEAPTSQELAVPVGEC